LVGFAVQVKRSILQNNTEAKPRFKFFHVGRFLKCFGYVAVDDTFDVRKLIDMGRLVFVDRGRLAGPFEGSVFVWEEKLGTGS
jgi:hypothetical protein